MASESIHKSSQRIQILYKLLFHENISLNICFLELSEGFRRNELELAMVNEPPVFELFHCKAKSTHRKKQTAKWAAIEVK